MKNKNIVQAFSLILGLSLMGCATQQSSVVGPWGYDFTVVRVVDSRPADDAKLMAAVPFTTQALSEAWQRAVPRAGWGAVPAELALRITQYEATHSGSSYALSMEADMLARAGEPAPSYRPDAVPVVAQLKGQCAVQGSTVTGKGQTLLFGQVFGINAPQGGAQNAPTGLKTLTPEGRDATLWGDLWTQCAAQLAHQLGDALLAAPPALPADTRGR